MEEGGVPLLDAAPLKYSSPEEGVKAAHDQQYNSAPSSIEEIPSCEIGRGRAILPGTEVHSQDGMHPEPGPPQNELYGRPARGRVKFHAV